METLKQTIILYQQDIGVEFGIIKYAILMIKNEKKEKLEGIELPHQESLRTLDEQKNAQLLEDIGKLVPQKNGKASRN